MSEKPRLPSPDRDPALDAAWKAHSVELPPPRIDAAIMAAAHREVRTRPRAVGDDDGIGPARGPTPAWWGLAAAATVGVIAFGVLQLAPHAPVATPPAVATDVPSQAQAPAPTPPATASTLAGSQRSDDAMTTPPADQRLQRREDVPKRQRNTTVAPNASSAPATKPSEMRESPTPPVALAPPPAAPRPFPGALAEPSLPAAPAARSAPAELAKSEADASAKQRQFHDRAEPVQKLAAAKPADRERAGMELQRAPDKPPARSPQSWVESIRALYEQQRFEDAARALNAFRDAYADADAQLPLSLKDWATSVKRR